MDKQKENKNNGSYKKDRSPIIHLRIDSDESEEVDDFVYLGSLIHWDGRQEKEMRRRISIAYNNTSKLKKLIGNRKISITFRKRFIQ